MVYLARQLVTMDQTMFEAALNRSDRRVKSAALAIAHKYEEKYLEDLISNIDSDELLVSQAARYSLVQISNLYLGGKNFVDFGPMITHDRDTKSSIAFLWKAWFGKAVKEGKKCKSIQAIQKSNAKTPAQKK